MKAKRCLGVLLAAVMALAVMPTALATDESGLQSLINNTAEGGILNLDADYILTDTVTISKGITINGNGHSVTAASGKNAFDVTADGVTLNGLTITNANSAKSYAVSVTAKNLTVTGCVINATWRGISFNPTDGNGASLTVSNTTIQNPSISNYDTSAAYGTDNRGISTGNVKGGTVSISNSYILGFKYSINAIVDSDTTTGLRDGNDTNFNVSDSTIKGWTALNCWSANTNFTFTDCTLMGINTLSGSWNGFATININNDIYAGYTNKESVVTIVGGRMIAKRYSTAIETAFTIDNELQTKIKFETSGRNLVTIDFYVPTGATAALFCYDPSVTASEAEAYENTKVVGFDDDHVDVSVYDISQNDPSVN